MARRGNRGAVLLQDRSPSTASLTLQRTSPEIGLRGGVYDNHMMDQKSSLDISGDPNERSHSWEISEIKNKKSTMVTVKRHYCARRKKTHRGRMTISNNED